MPKVQHTICSICPKTGNPCIVEHQQSITKLRCVFAVLLLLVPALPAFSLLRSLEQGVPVLRLAEGLRRLPRPRAFVPSPARPQAEQIRRRPGNSGEQFSLFASFGNFQTFISRRSNSVERVVSHPFLEQEPQCRLGADLPACLPNYS